MADIGGLQASFRFASHKFEVKCHQHRQCRANSQGHYDTSTKTLDQVGRAGAFLHKVRRKAAASDTGLSSVTDGNTKIHCLPLSDEGVLGKGLEEKLMQCYKKHSYFA